jgi:UDP-N-acetylglucosamine:LPS N-acetylglucosamine transferase
VTDTSPLAIGYYAHHHGAGHVTRALAIAACLREPVTLFGSRLPDRKAPENATYCRLPMDFDEQTVADSFPELHYVPIGVKGLRERMGTLVDWFRSAWPCLLVVDVSVEVALLARLCGVPTIYVRQRGMRLDAAHSLAYASATRLLAPYPQELEEPGLPASWIGKTDYAGLISRYTNTERCDGDTRFNVTVICGYGGSDLDAARLTAAARACPEWRWTVVGPLNTGSAADQPANLRFLGEVPDPLPWLRSAHVVVGSAGDSLVSEVAHLRCRFVCLPESRPFDEQRSTGRLLEAAGLAIVSPEWPSATKWPAILERAAQLSPDRWANLARGDGAARAADAISQAAAKVLL